MWQTNCNCDLSKIDFIKNSTKLPSCDGVWKLFADGLTKGIFQLETGTGKLWSKQLKPNSIDEVSALIAIIRPGVLEAVQDGKNLTKHFVDRKFGREPVPKFHPVVDKLLENTYNIIVYQEDALNIVKQTANFTLKEADDLRRGMGKKLPDVMAKVRSKYLEKAEQANIISSQQAEQLFDWIEKSQRYNFNNSHSVAYATNAYASAFAKYHFPLEFFVQYLAWAKDKIDPQQEIEDLIDEAKYFDINIKGPSLLSPQSDFHIDKNGDIRFGLGNIKGIGNSASAKLSEFIRNYKIEKLDWIDFLSFSDGQISKTVIEGLIESGALDCMKMGRRRMLFEYSKWQSLTNKEKEWIKERVVGYNGFDDALDGLLKCKVPTKRRIDSVSGIYSLLKNPPFALNDTVDWIANVEQRLLGVAVSCNKLDYVSGYANTTCQEFANGDSHNKVILAAEIRQIKYHKIKKGQSIGQEMVFLTVKDQSGTLDNILIFPDVLENTPIGGLATEGVGVIIIGERSAKGGLIVKKLSIAETN